uniref:Enoyl reductase (ER) domain-containing protein n=1 Tax=Bicosoecida sp. CB-2014 TaxID=1486930 RepID=A0A7S1G845_9STRA
MAAAGGAGGGGALDGTYKAIRVNEFGGPEVLVVEDLPLADLAPGPDEVVVSLKATGVNPVDTYIRAGVYANAPTPPYTPGSDGAGVVLAIGAGVTRCAPGDRVYVSGSISGTYAEATKAVQSAVHLLPPSVDFRQGAAIGVPYRTAYRALFQVAEAKPGEWVLINGASGAVGLASVQFGVARGLRIIGTAGTEAGMEVVRSFGADLAVSHKDFAALQTAVAEATGGAGVSVIVEMLANVNLGNDLKLLAERGRVAIVGSRGDVEITPRDLMAREASVRGVMLAKCRPHEKTEIDSAIYAGLRNGSLKPIVGDVFPMSEAADAHIDVISKSSGSFGKVVIAADCLKRESHRPT